MQDNRAIKFFEHIDYKENKEFYKKAFDLFEGEHNVLIADHYLWPHEFELTTNGAKLRELRELKTRYTNLIKPFVKRFISVAFKNEIQTENIVQKLTDKIYYNIDGKNNSFLRVFKSQIAKDFFLYGSCCIVVDAFKVDGVQSVEEAKQAGKRPLLEVVSPLNVKDWEYELTGLRFGKLNKIRYEFAAVSKRSSLRESPSLSYFSKNYERNEAGQIVVSLYSTTKMEGEKTNWKIVETPTVIEGLDEIPVVFFQGQSWVKDILDMALSRYNHESCLDSQLLFQAFQKVFAIGNFNLASDKLTINEGCLTMLAGEGSINVVEPTNPIALKERIEALTNNMYKVAFNQSRLMPSDSKAVEGADTMKESKADFHSLVIEAIKDLQMIGDNVLEFLFKFMGQEQTNEDALIIDSNLDDEDIRAELELVLAFMNEIKRVPSWYEAIQKKFANLMNLPEIEQIVKDLETQQTPSDVIDNLIDANT